MGKKRKHVDINEVLARPWCYYCEREFDDLKILLSHQKARHFKCDRCGRRLNTAGGLSVHLTQVHKEQLTKVENAIAGREGLGIEIFGMEGIPDDVKAQFDQTRKTKYFEEVQARREETGNPPPGTKEAMEGNKSRFGTEDNEALVKRFKAHVTKIDRGDVPEATAMEGVQPTSTALPTAVFPDQIQAGLRAPGASFPAPAPGFPPGHAFPGQVPLQSTPPFAQGQYPPPGLPGTLPARPAFLPPGQAPSNGLASAVDDLISSAQATSATTAEKKAKPGKDAKVRLVYSDNEISPEEKMASRPKYAIAVKV